jgi:kinesin family protein 5
MEKEMLEWAQNDLSQTVNLKELNTLKLEVERLQFEAKDDRLAYETLKETSAQQEARINELTSELTLAKEAAATAVEMAASPPSIGEPDRALQEQLQAKDAEIVKLNAELEAMKVKQTPAASASANFYADADVERMKLAMSQQALEFEAAKKSLMRDLQNRCEKIVELEIKLERLNESHDDLLQAQMNKTQERKLAVLERNLEQLTIVQKELIDQNANLKRQLQLADRKMANRNERIADLESMLHDLNRNMSADREKFDREMSSMMKRMMENGVSPSTTLPGEGRIAKPLRGGQETTSSAPFSTSWFSNILGSNR